VCVAMLDLDHFKDFNDKLGHQSGDRLLKASAAAWRAQLRATDAITRYGGEEFALVLPNCSLEDATDLLERVRAATPAGQTASAGGARGARGGACGASCGSRGRSRAAPPGAEAAPVGGR